eukprot:tig00000093_g3564.t1
MLHVHDDSALLRDAFETNDVAAAPTAESELDEEEERKARSREAAKKCRAKKKMIHEHLRVENVQLRQELEELRERVQKANLAALSSGESQLKQRASELLQQSTLSATTINKVMSLRKEMHASAGRAVSELSQILPAVAQIEVRVWFMTTWLRIKRSGANPTDPLLRAINESDGPLHQNLDAVQRETVLRHIEAHIVRLGRLAADAQSLREMVEEMRAAGATLAEDVAWFDDDFMPALNATLEPGQVAQGWRFLEAAAPALQQAVLGYRLPGPFPPPGASPPEPSSSAPPHATPTLAFVPSLGPAPASAPPLPMSRAYPLPAFPGADPGPALGALGAAPPPSGGPRLPSGPPPPTPALGAAPRAEISPRLAAGASGGSRAQPQSAQAPRPSPAAALAADPPIPLWAPPRAAPAAKSHSEPRAPAAAPAPSVPVMPFPGLAPPLPPRKAPAAAPRSIPEQHIIPPTPPSQPPPPEAGPPPDPDEIREMIRAAVAHEMSSFFPVPAAPSWDFLAPPLPVDALSPGSEGSGGSGSASWGAGGSPLIDPAGAWFAPATPEALLAAAGLGPDPEAAFDAPAAGKLPLELPMAIDLDLDVGVDLGGAGAGVLLQSLGRLRTPPAYGQPPLDLGTGSL